MIKHIVMWKLKEQAEGKTKQENAAEIKHILEALDGKIPQLKTIEVGINLLEAPTNNFDVVLNTTFDSMADLDVYQVHDLHVAAGAFIKKVVAERVCVDYLA